MPDGITETRAPLAWSFSRLTDYEKCPRMAYFKYVEKRPMPPQPEDNKGEIARLRGIAVHEGADAYIKGEADELAPELKKVKEFVELVKEQYAKGIVEVEEEWAYDRDWQRTGWFDKNCWLRIKQDAFIKWPDGTWEVIDWKTGKSFGNEVKHSQQGLLYAIAAFMRYPEMQRVRIRFVYTDEGKWDRTKEYSRELVMRMLPNWDDRAGKFTTATQWPVKPNAINCRFCWFSPNNGGDGSCPAGVEVTTAKPSSRSK